MTPLRPLFNDGAILGASDLTALGQLDRDRDARHARHLHTPGIAAGLELTSVEQTDEASNRKYLDITLQPGYAIDGTGRELVVGAALPVSADRFTGDIPEPVKEPGEAVTVWYPVFIHGLDAEVTATNGQLGCQGGAGPTRVEEDVELEFGRPGDATLEQPVPALDAGPGDGSWRVLVGFVRLDTDIDRFVEVTTTADGVRVPNAGVRAGLMAGQAGRVEVRPDPTPAAGAPAVVVDSVAGGSFVFGLHNGTGGLTPLLSVDSSGNLTAEGTLSGAQRSGTVLVTTGAAFDGAIIPLPEGADLDAIDSGAQHLSILVVPRHPVPAGAERFLPGECSVDDERRVRCWGTWFTPTAPHNPRDVSTACDYIVLLTVANGGA
jgi:hypothetical protein